MVGTFSTFAIAKMLYVDPGSVANWIDQGMLSAHRTPGGHRRVEPDALVHFLRKHDMPIPNELSTSPTHVLVVDDEEAVAKMIAQAIKTAHPDFEVTEAHDGFNAGAIIASQSPGIVILDLRMPGMDGYEVCRLIKSQDSTKNSTVLAMTAYPSPESEKRIMGCGAKICLTKPLDLDHLIAEIRIASGK